jgi:hypothetical protein
MGIRAILSHKTFSSRFSSVYMKTFRTFYELEHPPNVQEQLNQNNPNIAYSINASTLWRVMASKLR